jgi:metallo-beta-lactamase class B
VLATGLPATGDPQFGELQPFPAVQVDRVVRDGEEVRIGDQMLTVIATPGHTEGATSWRWVSCDGGVCRMIVYADSLSPASNDAYRFSDHPKDVAAFRSSIAKIAASPCEILVTPHPSASHLSERFAAGKPLLEEDACKAYANDRLHLLDERLAEEASSKKQKS